MKPILRSALVVGLLLVLAGDLRAQTPVFSSLFGFLELTDADLERIDLHDGTVDDWLEVLGEPTLSAIEFYASPGFAGDYDLYDQADLDFRIWLAWHDATNRIYVAMERSDDNYTNTFNRRSSRPMSFIDSGVSFSVDGDGGRDSERRGGINYESNELFLQEYARDSQWYAAIAETFDEGPRVQLVNYFVGPDENWYEWPPFAEGGGTSFGENPTISITEFYITPFDLFVWDDPTASRVSDLSPGKLINFSLGIGDHEGEPDNQGGYPQTSYFILQDPQESEVWSDGFLLSASGEMPDDSAVESDTWARIKATFTNKTIRIKQGNLK